MVKLAMPLSLSTLEGTKILATVLKGERSLALGISHIVVPYKFVSVRIYFFPFPMFKTLKPLSCINFFKIPFS
jgi:hypothetical protein